MPWTSADAEKHLKGLSRKQRKKWASIANAVFESCKDEERSIRIACSKFDGKVPFNPVITPALEEEARKIAKFDDLMDIPEMEIFRPGTHNGDEFTESDLQEIADNFNRLKEEVRPKLKITHRENQKSIAGLASYGDIASVFMKQMQDGGKRLFASIKNVPREVVEFIKNRRFPERSIEIYPAYKLGTSKEGTIYRNVLKAIALLGHEMPAVPGMAPIKLSENAERQKTICFGEVCFICEEEAENHRRSELAVKLMSLNSKLEGVKLICQKQ